MNRVLLASLLGAVATFLWSGLAHEALPLGEAGIQMITNEQPLLASMQSTLGAGSGMYMFPNMPTGPDAQQQYAQKIAGAPSGLLLYSSKREFSFGKLLGIQFGIQLLVTAISVYLLTLTTISTFLGRVGFMTGIGVVAACLTNLEYWTWYAFPATYTLAAIFTHVVGFICAGLVVAAVLKKSPARVAAPARAAA